MKWRKENGYKLSTPLDILKKTKCQATRAKYVQAILIRSQKTDGDEDPSVRHNLLYILDNSETSCYNERS